MNVVELAMSTRTVIDADGLVLGRMASVIAKRLLAGETIELVNAQNVVISGNKVKLVEEWKEFLIVGGFGKGPVHHRRPHEIVRRTVRGMLPYRIKKGEEAYKRLHVHIGIPEEFEKAEMEKMSDYHSSKLNHRGITVGELAESIGWNKMGVE